MHKAQSIIMYDSPQAASIQTVSGWVSNDGRYFGDNEKLARYCGATHKSCSVDSDHPIYPVNSYCDACSHDEALERFNAMPIVEWDGSTMLYLCEHDLYLSSASSVQHFCDEYGLELKDLKLVLCEEIGMQEVDENYWEDDFAGDVDLAAPIQEALDTLNAAIRKHGKAASWMPSSKRVVML